MSSLPRRSALFEHGSKGVQLLILRIVRENLTPVPAIINRPEHSGHARFDTHEYEGDFEEA